MSPMKVFLSLGSNIGDSEKILKSAFEKIQKLPLIEELTISDLYNTTPVSEIKQKNFLNAACSFKTTYSLLELFEKTESIENEFDKKSLLKNAPRYLDIDILFFGETKSDKLPCLIPHPRWKERLFVLKPLSDITERVPFEKDSIEQIIAQFTNPNNETVTKYIP